MAIRKALFHGKTVYAEQGEELRGAELTCIHCGAKMHLHRFPNSNCYYFATNPGYEHQSVCKEYAGRKDAPVLDRISPEELVAMISKLPVKKRVSPGGGGGNVDREGEEDDIDVEYSPRRITSLLQMLKTGMYDENPFDRTGLGSTHIIMDYVVFDKWPKYVWGRTDNLVKLGARIIDARWVGSLQYGKEVRAKVIELMKGNKEIWLTMYWLDKTKQEYEFVRFCLNCENAFSSVKKKLFTASINPNGTFDNFKPKKEPLDIMVGAVWGIMSRDQCKESCPLYYPDKRYCNKCRGAYGCVVNSKNQVIVFTDDNLTKNKGKKYYDTDI